MSRPKSLLLAVLLLLAAPALAWAQTDSKWIGLTAGTPLIVEQDRVTCRATSCMPRPSLPFPPFAGTSAAGGGTAWDATEGVVWVSNGLDLAAFDPDRRCSEFCAPHRPLAPGVSITGLAVNEARRTLVVSDSTDLIHYFPLTCPLSLSSRPCRAPVPAGQEIGGIACSDLEDLIFYTTSDFTPAGAPDNRLWAAPFTSPCRPICSIALPIDCNRRALAPIHGVAYDACERTVYVTDGVIVMSFEWLEAPRCFRMLRCCEQTSILEPYIGLCVKPSQPTLFGRACTSSPCPSCPALSHVLDGDPLLGNASFGLGLEFAPSGSTALLMIGLGPVTPPGLPLPPFCGRLMPFSLGIPLILGPLPVLGFGGCTGSATLPVPIPLDPLLCGLELHSQFLGVCGGTTTIGTYVSPTLSWRLTSS